MQPVLPLMLRMSPPCMRAQRHTCRIVFMVVVMSIVSVLALSFPQHSIYMVTLRDWWVGRRCGMGGS